jgi:peptidoglycan hydrolase CwlO-like protein
VDAATISALLLGAAGVIGAFSTWYSSASKNNVDRISTLLDAQDKRITEQQARLTEAYAKMDQQAGDLRTANLKIDTQQESLHEANRAIDDLQRKVATANRRIRNLQRERDAFHTALKDAGVPVPEVVHEEDPSAH